MLDLRKLKSSAVRGSFSGAAGLDGGDGRDRSFSASTSPRESASPAPSFVPIRRAQSELTLSSLSRPHMRTPSTLDDFLKSVGTDSPNEGNGYGSESVSEDEGIFF